MEVEPAKSVSDVIRVKALTPTATGVSKEEEEAEKMKKEEEDKEERGEERKGETEERRRMRGGKNYNFILLVINVCFIFNPSFFSRPSQIPWPFAL